MLCRVLKSLGLSLLLYSSKTHSQMRKSMHTESIFYKIIHIYYIKYNIIFRGCLPPPTYFTVT